MINRKRLIRIFLDLVKIDSPSGEEEKIAKEIVKRLKELGGKVAVDSYGNVIGKFPGTGQPIMLNAHMDTVEPGRGIKPIVKGDKIISDGKTILGGDPKAGVAIILEALTSLRENKTKHIPIEAVFTREEETGLLGAKNLDYTKISSKRGITFDGEEEAHRIDVSSPGYHKVDVTIIGKSAHAGLAPEEGVSAIKIASEIIAALHLGRIDEETTANIGMIEGGSVRNTVPEKTHFKGEIRSRNKKKLEKHSNHFKHIVSQVGGKYPAAKVELLIEKEADGYVFSDTHKTFIHVKRVLREMKLEPVYHHSGGLTDTNIFRMHDIAAITVGTGDYNPHTTREYVLVSQMEQAARFCEKLVLV